jgi:hypothetical protein
MDRRRAEPTNATQDNARNRGPAPHPTPVIPQKQAQTQQSAGLAITGGIMTRTTAEIPARPPTSGIARTRRSAPYFPNGAVASGTTESDSTKRRPQRAPRCRARRGGAGAVPAGARRRERRVPPATGPLKRTPAANRPHHPPRQLTRGERRRERNRQPENPPKPARRPQATARPGRLRLTL